MNRAVSLAILAGGILLTVFGAAASKSFSFDISRFFAGSPTDKAIWMLVGGVVAIIIGWWDCCVDQSKVGSVGPFLLLPVKRGRCLKT